MSNGSHQCAQTTAGSSRTFIASHEQHLADASTAPQSSHRAPGSSEHMPRKFCHYMRCRVASLSKFCDLAAFTMSPPEQYAARWIQYLSRLGAAKLHERTEMNLPSIGLRLFHDSSFGWYCLRISGVLPSSLFCSRCEASQAAGTVKALGIAIEIWA